MVPTLMDKVMKWMCTGSICTILSTKHRVALFYVFNFFDSFNCIVQGFWTVTFISFA